MDVLPRLQQWYAAQCDGDWEHQYGVLIETLDNPGWRVKIDLAGTVLEDRPFTPVAVGVGASDHPDQPRWFHCTVLDGVWQGAGDETQLVRLLEVFLDWASGVA
ncbi:MAG TPA: immunity 53 family protein [Fimbriiglobus sp.]|nr:immunity 53 family protein [Fimbriiglobus sp.]